MRLEQHLGSMDEASKLEIHQTVDQFVRFLIGDRKVAVRELERIQGNKFIDIPQDSGEYNKMYGNLFKDIRKAVEKNIK